MEHTDTKNLRRQLNRMNIPFQTITLPEKGDVIAVDIAKFPEEIRVIALEQIAEQLSMKKDFTGVSTHVKSIDYNTETKDMEVIFGNGSKYIYIGVSQEVYDEALAAPSIGTFLNQEIKGKFTYKKA